MGERSGGGVVVDLLRAEQVRYIFGIVGATFLDVLDALYDDRSLEYINYYVEHPDQVGDTMREAFAAGKPAIVEVPIDPDELPTPVAAITRPTP